MVLYYTETSNLVRVYLLHGVDLAPAVASLAPDVEGQALHDFAELAAVLEASR